MTQTEHNMKSCPFCGKEPRFAKYSGTYGYSPNRYFIECECGASMSMTDNYTKSTAECKTELIDRWNSRK